MTGIAVGRIRACRSSRTEGVLHNPSSFSSCSLFDYFPTCEIFSEYVQQWSGFFSGGYLALYIDTGLERPGGGTILPSIHREMRSLDIYD